MAGARVFTLNLLESFRLTSPEGARIDVVSKKGMALLAMLAMAAEGERTRAWLQDRLWGTRERARAQSGLRRELSNLRKCLNGSSARPALRLTPLVRLDLTQFDIDARPADGALLATAEFLEGFDIAGEEGFEEWLREQRRLMASRSTDTVEAKAPSANAETEQPTGSFLDLSLSAARFDDRPALAVLPFTNLTSDDVNDYICEGLSEDLIDRLSRLRWLPVIARNSSFAFNPDKTDPRLVGRSLGAKYILEGRLRTVGRSFSISLNLSDTATGVTLWSHRLPLPPQRSQDALDPLVAALVSVLDAPDRLCRTGRARGKRQNRPEFNDLIWRGRWHLNRLTRADADMARGLFTEALELEPTSPEALIQATFSLGWTLWQDAVTISRSPRCASWRSARSSPILTTGAGTCWPASPRCGGASRRARGPCCSARSRSIQALFRRTPNSAATAISSASQQPRSRLCGWRNVSERHPYVLHRRRAGNGLWHVGAVGRGGRAC